jgi:hypothetical protein
MTAYIISHNRLTCLLQLCFDLVDRGCTPVIVDNSSTYPPLLEWLKVCPFEVHRLPNTGSRSPWKHNIVTGEYYIVSDHDLGISNVPLDMVDKMMEVLEESPTSIKVGLSLRIDDLPDNDFANTAKAHEERFWLTKAGDHYSAPIDTTLALYSAKRLAKAKATQFYNAIRLAPPYTARHLPWYNTPENLTDEEKFYINSLVSNEGHWNHEFKRINGPIS